MTKAEATPPAALGTSYFDALSAGALLRRNLVVLLAASAATAAVELGALALARGVGTGPREAILVCLAAMTMWVALASAPLAAGGRTNWDAALRGAIPADASLLVLLVLPFLGSSPDTARSYVDFPGALGIYCVLAAVAVFSIAAVCCGRSATARQVIAAAVAVVLAAAIAGPFWTGGLIHAGPYPAATALVAWAIRANPFYAVTGAIAERMRFFWHEWGLMYDRIGSFRDYTPPPLRWHETAILYAALAAALGLVATIRRAGRGPRRTLARTAS